MNAKQRAEKILEINPYKLDEEWLEQAKLFFSFAADLADVKMVHDKAKANLELVEAELDREIRSDPAKYNIDKVTETSIKNAVITRSRYQKAQEELITARYDVAIHQAAVDAMDQRKKALENMVQLDGRNYYAEPTAPKGAREKVDAMKTDRAFGARKSGR